MEYTRTALLQLPGQHLTFVAHPVYGAADLAGIKRLSSVRDVEVQGDGRYVDSEQRLYLHLHVTGTMVVPCDITGEPVDVPLDTESDEVYSFKSEDDIDIIPAQDGAVHIDPTVVSLIGLEIPLKVVKPGPIVYPKGDGWAVVTEQEYEEQKRVDPRLAVLKDYHPKDE